MCLCLNHFKSFKESNPSISDFDFILIGLQVEFKEYKPYQSLCRLGEPSIETYYVLEGSISVCNVSLKNYDEANTKGHIMHSEGKGANLGEEGVMYGSNR